MEKKTEKTQRNKKNYSPTSIEKTISLDSTSDTDIIECSIEEEKKYDFTKKKECAFKSQSGIQSSKTVQARKLMTSYSTVKSSKDALRLTLRSHGSTEDAVSRKKTKLSFQTPQPNKNSKEPDSIIRKMISGMKNSPDIQYLSKSKLRNIEQWLNENSVETVKTPPFMNLSVTPVNSLKKKFSSARKDKKIKHPENSIDSDVEGVLRAVYGDDWQENKIHNRAKTEPKKKSKKFFSPVSMTKKKALKDFHSVRKIILNGKKLNLADGSDRENNFDDSVLSGVQMIDSDSSGCDHEQTKVNIIKILKKEKSCEASSSSVESLCCSPAEQKNLKSAPLENQKQSSKTPAAKKFVPEVAVKTPKKTFLASLSVSTPTSKCHPEAQYYKINFRSKKEELVKKLYKLYNSQIFDRKLGEDLNFSWNVKLRGTAGYCYNKRITKSTGEVLRVSRIEFSTKIVDRADRLRDTMIHELCHAASWVIDGVLDGHGDFWSKWASRAMNRFPELPLIKRCHNYEIVSKYLYRCTSCGYSIKRHSKSINTERKRCGHCYGVLELLINKKRKGKNEIPEFDTTRTLPTPNKFALFVKENYQNVKSTKTNARHSEIMKTLSQQYALLKNGSKSLKKSLDD